MRVNVSLNNEDGAYQTQVFQQQQQQQQCATASTELYTHDPYQGFQAIQQPQQQVYQLQPPVQHHVPNTYSTPTQSYYQSPSLASSAGTNSSQSFYEGSSNSQTDDEVTSVNSGTMGGSSTTCSMPAKKLRPMGTHAQDRGHVDPSRFKTEPCSYFLRGEACPYTPGCAFAHGDNEKRSRRRNVREGVTKVNTLPRSLVHHEAWVQTTKYTRKTGPSNCSPAGFAPQAVAPVAVPAPSFTKKAQ